MGAKVNVIQYNDRYLFLKKLTEMIKCIFVVRGIFPDFIGGMIAKKQQRNSHVIAIS